MKKKFHSLIPLNPQNNKMKIFGIHSIPFKKYNDKNLFADKKKKYLILNKKKLNGQNNFIHNTDFNVSSLLRESEKKLKKNFSLGNLHKKNNKYLTNSNSLNNISKENNLEISCKKPFIFHNKLIKNAMKKENERLIDKEREKIKKRNVNTVEKYDNKNSSMKKSLSYGNYILTENNNFYPLISKIKLKNDINWKNYFSSKSFSNKKLMNMMSKLRMFG